MKSTPKLPRLPALALLLVLFATLAGCGYRLLSIDGPESGGGKAPIRIRAVEDRSREPLFGAELRARLAEMGLERGEISIEDRGDVYQLDVKLRSVRETARAYVEGDLPREYLLTASADATLHDGRGQLVWKNTDIKERREFPAGEDVDTARRNKDRALVILAEDLAGEILRRASLAVEGLEAESDEQ